MKVAERFRVKPGTRVDLSKLDPDAVEGVENREQVKNELKRYQKKLRKLQELLFIERKRALLICLQAMDTGGKDGTIRHVFAVMNPQGCRVANFKQPTSEELSHDFLWRAHRAAPPLGDVTIFNRSHYEDVLIVPVHHLVTPDVWARRYEQINAFEKILSDNNTHILKFYLHISKAEQLRRLKARLDDPRKQWKISEGDFEERQYWDDYQRAFENVLSLCSTEYAPWFIIPANRKWYRNWVVARIVVEFLEGLDMQMPKITVDLDRIRREYYEAERE
jgi:PPK2 family polyphosphate:nucleotide phosphotransferase